MYNKKIMFLLLFCLPQFSCNALLSTKSTELGAQAPEPLVIIEPRLLGVNLNIVSDFESVDTNLHWPGGNSGPTIGRGIDLGHATPSMLHKLFRGLVDSQTMSEFKSARGVVGPQADVWVAKHKHINITGEVADIVFNRACKLFWSEVIDRFGPEVEKLNPDVKGAVLSIAVNYGTYSDALASLKQPIQTGNIHALAERFEYLASTNESLSKRRMLEHDVILISTTNQRTKETIIQD